MADALPVLAREHPAVLWRGWPLVRALVILVPLLQILSLLWLVWARTPDVPVGDEWDTAVLVHAVRQGSVRWGDFWAFHSEHRILVPRVVNLTLIQLTRWNRQIAMTFDLAVVAVTAAFLLGCLRRTAQGTGAVFALGVPFSLLLFSPSHYENWLAPFQLAFLGTVFGVACCLWALTTQPRGARGLSLAVFGALVATLSSLNGLMVWIAFLPNVRRAGYRRTLVWGCVALAAALAYAIGFTGGGKVASPLPDLLGYALGYLGAPVGYPTLWLAQLAGLLSLALVCANLCVHALLRRDPTPLGAWLGLAVFALACTALTTLGRGPSLGVGMALTSRYQIFGALWWVATLVIAWLAVAPAPTPAPARRPPSLATLRRAMMRTNLLALCLLCACLVRANVDGFQRALAWTTPRWQNQRCILDYRTAPDGCLSLYYRVPAIVRVRAAYLERDRVGIFRHTPTPAGMREPAAPASAPVVPPAVARRAQPTQSSIDWCGTIVAFPHQEPVLVPRDGPIAVGGWAVDAAAGAPAGGVLVVVDDTLHFSSEYGLERSEVAEALADDSYRWSGFAATIPSDALAPGRHVVSIKILAADRQSYYEPDTRVELELR